MPSTFTRTAVAAFAAINLVCACTVGPNYARPEVVVPETFKELPPTKVAKPSDDEPRGPWWKVFDDPTLDAMERDAEAANQTLRAAEANYRQARAAVQATRAGQFPTLGLSADANRARASGNVTDDDRRRGTRDARHAVMLGEPEPPIAPSLRMLREIE